jgi:hypothetical protein
MPFSGQGMLLPHLFILGIDQINDHLDIDYVLPPISARDKFGGQFFWPGWGPTC